MHYASSLSYHTMLSIIPLLIISMSIFTKLPSFEIYYEKITSFIFSSLLPSHQEVFTEYIQTFLGNTLNLGILGFVTILFTSMMFFMEYDYIVNKILKSQQKSFWQRLSSYWTLITLAPLALGFSFYASSVLQSFLRKSEFTSWINILEIFPYLIVWMLFFATYMISSGKPLATRIVLFASFISSLVWYICKSLFVIYVSYNTSYLSMYGSFSIAIFFLVWIYASWIIFLYGVKLCEFLTHTKWNDTKEDKNHSNHLKSNSN